MILKNYLVRSRLRNNRRQLGGLSPATAQSGGIGAQASENDLQVDSWQVTDLFGHDLSDQFSPSYPFWAKSGTSFGFRNSSFENTLDNRPLEDDFVVAVTVGEMMWY